MRVAFTLFIDRNWTGGLNYLRNLFSALQDFPAAQVQPVLFISPDTPREAYASLLPHLAEPPVVVQGWTGGRAARWLGTMLRGYDKISLQAFRAARIDAVFFNDVWYGFRFPLPTIGWIADFQHCHLKQMFTPLQRFKRGLKYSVYCYSASRLMVSSEDGRHDGETFYAAARGRIDAVPFAVQLAGDVHAVDARAVARQHGLPEKFLYFPGQLWRHKNHLLLVQALARLKAVGTDIVVAASGQAADARHPGYPGQVMQALQAAGLEDSLRMLGHVPYSHIMPLMRASAAVLNPSLFEGWSTPVEEAKALGVPLVLSGLRVHREQAPEDSVFFDPNSADDLANALHTAWQRFEPGPRPALEAAAMVRYAQRREAFAGRFAQVVKAAMAVG